MKDVQLVFTMICILLAVSYWIYKIFIFRSHSCCSKSCNVISEKKNGRVALEIVRNDISNYF